MARKSFWDVGNFKCIRGKNNKILIVRFYCRRPCLGVTIMAPEASRPRRRTPYLQLLTKLIVFVSCNILRLHIQSVTHSLVLQSFDRVQQLSCE